MRLFLATCILGVFLGVGAGIADAGGPVEPEQHTLQKTIVVQPGHDGNTGLIVVAIVGALGTLGAAYITTRNRKG